MNSALIASLLEKELDAALGQSGNGKFEHALGVAIDAALQQIIPPMIQAAITPLISSLTSQIDQTQQSTNSQIQQTQQAIADAEARIQAGIINIIPTTPPPPAPLPPPTSPLPPPTTFIPGDRIINF